MMGRVLVVDDDIAVREALGQTLELAGFHPLVVGSFVAAKDLIGPAFDGVILSDIRMPGRDGFHLLQYAQEKDADLPVVMLTGEGDIPMAVKAMELGAFGFLEKPCASADLLPVLERAIKTRKLVLENRALRVRVQMNGHVANPELGLIEQMTQVERSIMEQALRRANGRAALAAQALKVPRKTFYDKLTRHGLKPEAFRDDHE